MGRSEWMGRWAVVTGASSGIGEAFADRLGADGAHVVLVARREDRLKEIAARLESAHGTQTRVVALDLGRPDAADELHDRLAAEGLEIDLLINNAGFGLYGRDLEIPWERVLQMLELDIVALTQLTRRFAADMVERGHGAILQVASVGAYQPSPTYAAYSAAKAYVLSYGEALAYELAEAGVRVCVLSPGVTASEFLEVSGQAPALYHRLTMMSAEDVVASGLRALRRGRTSVIPGFANKLAAFSLRALPRTVQARVAYWTMNTGMGS